MQTACMGTVEVFSGRHHLCASAMKCRLVFFSWPNGSFKLGTVWPYIAKPTYTDPTSLYLSVVQFEAFSVECNLVNLS
jgi:hypothetical protein